jgi:hypothetical protein
MSEHLNRRVPERAKIRIENHLTIIGGFVAQGIVPGPTCPVRTDMIAFMVRFITAYVLCCASVADSLGRLRFHLAQVRSINHAVIIGYWFVHWISLHLGLMMVESGQTEPSWCSFDIKGLRSSFLVMRIECGRFRQSAGTPTAVAFLCSLEVDF